jgi:hypothetical protein
LADEPYLADVARLDWAVHRAGFAADDPGPPRGLELLAELDPARALLRLRPGTAVVASRHAIVEIWRAHHCPVPPDADEARAGKGDERFAAARRALLEGRAQAAWVTRAGGSAVHVLELGDAGARFTEALLGGVCLEEGLQIAGAAFDFEAWLIQALREGALAAVQAAPPPGAAR